MTSERTTAEVENQLRALGVREGAVLLVHTSFRSVRPITGGPLGLVEALRRALGPRGTLVMPTMTDGETLFDPRSTPTAGMGITAELFWRQPGVVRSTHPGGSFTAVGPHAEPAVGAAGCEAHRLSERCRCGWHVGAAHDMMIDIACAIPPATKKAYAPVSWRALQARCAGTASQESASPR